MELKHNPFRFGGDLGANEIVDRVEETAQVESTIRNGEKLFLIGPRRFGKTSILRAARESGGTWCDRIPSQRGRPLC